MSGRISLDRIAAAADVIDPVWSLLDAAYTKIGGEVPTCLERDFNFPDFSRLTAEVDDIICHHAIDHTDC